jgi:hypothetical protein
MTDQADDFPKPEPPPNLRAGGTELWDGILARYELRVDEIVLLEAACRERDLVDGMQLEIESAIAAGRWTVKGSMGQDVANPLLPELRHHRGTLSSLLKRLGLDVADEEAAGGKQLMTRSEIGRHAARARWSRSS